MRNRQFAPSAFGLEARNLMTASVYQAGATVAVVADPATDNTVHASIVGNLLDVDIDGVDHFYPAASVNLISFDASRTAAGTTQTFVNSTPDIGFAVGGAGTNHFVAGTGFDVFLAGNGSNTFDAGSGYVFFIGNEVGDMTANLGSGGGLVMGMGGPERVNGGGGNYIVF